MSLVFRDTKKCRLIVHKTKREGAVQLICRTSSMPDRYRQFSRVREWSYESVDNLNHLQALSQEMAAMHRFYINIEHIL